MRSYPRPTIAVVYPLICEKPEHALACIDQGDRAIRAMDRALAQRTSVTKTGRETQNPHSPLLFTAISSLPIHRSERQTRHSPPDRSALPRTVPAWSRALPGSRRWPIFHTP
jgi:hypothetical protein